MITGVVVAVETGAKDVVVAVGLDEGKNDVDEKPVEFAEAVVVAGVDPKVIGAAILVPNGVAAVVDEGVAPKLNEEVVALGRAAVLVADVEPNPNVAG